MAGVHLFRDASPVIAVTRPLARAADVWHRFWFEPRPTSTLALFRIAFGMIVTAWTVSLIPNLFAFFGPDGIEPGRPGHHPGEWGLLTTYTGSFVLVMVLVATLVGAVALTLGLFTRVAAVVVFVGVVSFEQRNGLINNSGDALIRNLAFYCALAPSGASLSLDRLRSAPDTFWQFPPRAPWALRLIQIQLSVGYLSAVWHKVQGKSWRDGTAVSFALRIEDIGRFDAPDFITRSIMLTEVLTFGTLALELMLGMLVWSRIVRPLIMPMGIVLHLTTEFFLMVGFFGFAMLAAYLAFLAPEAASRHIMSVRDRLARRSWWRGDRHVERGEQLLGRLPKQRGAIGRAHRPPS
jgi:Vitamin K-dependent gamma-carboxylase